MSTFTLWAQHAAYVGAALAAVAAGIGVELALLAAARRRLGRGGTDESGAAR
jgi:hypothetical protein